MKVKLNIPAIGKLMAAYGYTQTELAKRAGLSRQGLNVMLARGTCSYVNAGRIASALEVDIEEIWKED